jgi:hypothetical protein
VDGPILVLKGPEVAAHYPFPALRPYGDLDLLVEDVAAAEGALVEAGFTLSGSEESVIPGYIHDRPLRYEHLPLAIELHRSPGWLSWMTPPSNAELFAMAVPSATGVHGITTMPVAAHALFLAVHSWRHGPYHSLLHLVDIDLMRRNATEPEIGALAAEWGMSNLWSRTTVTIDWLLYDAPPPGHLDRYWTRHLTKWRPRTTREYYLATRTKGIAAEHVPAKARAIGSDIWDSFALRPGESPISVARYMWRKLTAGNAPASTSARRR